MIYVLTNLQIVPDRYRAYENGYLGRPGWDGAEINIVASMAYASGTDGYPIATVYYDGAPIFATLPVAIAEYDHVDDALDFYGIELFEYKNRFAEAGFLAFADAIGYTEGAYETFLNDEHSTVGGTVEDKAVSFERFRDFVDQIRAEAFKVFDAE